MTITSARYVSADYVEVTDDVAGLYTLEYPAQDGGTRRHQELDDWVAAGNTITPVAEDLPPTAQEEKQSAASVADQLERQLEQDDRRIAIGAPPLFTTAERNDTVAYLAEVYIAQDNNLPPAEPPVSVRQQVSLEGDTTGQCVIKWHEFTGGWPGWGFKAEFQRGDITALGLKVYDENDAFLYALTFQSTEHPDRWVTETPAGFATPTKVQRSFEIIAGSAPVTNFISLTDQVDYVSLLVRWQPGDPV